MVIKDDNLPYNVQMFKAFIHSDVMSYISHANSPQTV